MTEAEQPPDHRKIRIFVASPGELRQERDQITRVIEEIRLTLNALAPEKNVNLELIRWETHAHPGLGRPQGLINRQIGEYEIFVGLLWGYMGTPTGLAESGTEEEFRTAYERWNEDKSLQVMFYFCQQPIPIPHTTAELDQLTKVVRFRTELADKGLVWDYASRDTFADTIRPHLLLALGQMLSPATPAAQHVAERASAADTTELRQRVLALAQEYERRRASMEAGPARTREMEAVVSEMRKLAFDGHVLLPELVSISASAGARLAAIVFLRETPNAEHITWLGERQRSEAAFVAYHAALALLAAVRALRATHREELTAAIVDAKRGLQEREGAEAHSSDRWRVLEQADQELHSAQKSG